jgi:hypothetical protein
MSLEKKSFPLMAFQWSQKLSMIDILGKEDHNSRSTVHKDESF